MTQTKTETNARWPLSEKRRKKRLWWERAWSLVEGCTPVSPACLNCWSAAATHMRAAQQGNAKILERYGGLTTSGVFNGKIRLMENSMWTLLRVRKPTVWAIWNDLFHKDVPFEFIVKAYGVMIATPWHTYVVLTKRLERAAEYYDWWVDTATKARYQSGPTQMAMVAIKSFHSDLRKANDYYLEHYDQSRRGCCDDPVPWPLPNVVIGTTVEIQAAADERIPHLRKCPAARRALSIEPLLGPLPRLDLEGIHWAIVGAETGRNARPMKLDWARSIRDQCKAAGVPFWFKSAGPGVAIPPDLDIREVPARG